MNGTSKHHSKFQSKQDQSVDQDGYTGVTKDQLAAKMGTKNQMSRFCIKNLGYSVHPAKHYSKAPYFFKLILGEKKCISHK
jgi:hypothetical protein